MPVQAPPTPTRAYAKLQGADFVYYLTKLSMTIGREKTREKENRKKAKEEDEKVPASEIQVIDESKKITDVEAVGRSSASPTKLPAQNQNRTDAADLSFPKDSAVSRIHAQISYSSLGQCFELHVFGKNGMILDGSFIPAGSKPMPLRSQSLLEFGSSVYPIRCTFLLPPLPAHLHGSEGHHAFVGSHPYNVLAARYWGTGTVNSNNNNYNNINNTRGVDAGEGIYTAGRTATEMRASADSMYVRKLQLSILSQSQERFTALFADTTFLINLIGDTIVESKEAKLSVDDIVERLVESNNLWIEKHDANGKAEEETKQDDKATRENARTKRQKLDDGSSQKGKEYYVALLRDSVRHALTRNAYFEAIPEIETKDNYLSKDGTIKFQNHKKAAKWRVVPNHLHRFNRIMDKK